MITVEFETKEFNRRLNKFLSNSNISVDKGIRKAGFDVLANIFRPPPFGTHPVDTGRARAGWYLSAKGLGLNFNFERGTSDLSSKAGVKSDGVDKGKTEGNFRDHTGNKYFNKYVELVNGVYYIMFLEFGHSDAAPAGMVRVALRQMRGGKLPRQFGKSYREEWRRYFR